MAGGLFIYFIKAKTISVVVMLVHGYVSAAIFYYIGRLYYNVLTRRVYFSSISYKILTASLALFLLVLLANFGVPPFLSRITEVLLFSYFFLFSSLFGFFLFFYGIAVCYFCVYLLLLLVHGKSGWSFSFSSFVVDSIRGALIVGMGVNFFFLSLLF